MRSGGAITLAGLVAAFALACPLGPFSGGRLPGEVQSGPIPDWTFVNDAELCQIETNPGDPYSVNTWCVGYESNLYIPTSMIYGPLSPEERDWVRNVSANPRVRVRAAGVVYERNAVRVAAGAEYQAVRSLLVAKYELAPDDLDPEREIWIYRMEASAAR